MPVHQCPRCELRFATEHDLDQHLVADHRVDPATLPQRPPRLPDDPR